MRRTFPHPKLSIADRGEKGKREFQKVTTNPGVPFWGRPETIYEVERDQQMARAVKDVYYGKTLRKSFARSEEILDMPYLLEIQKKSYKWFFETGLQEVFNGVDSITDYAGNLELSFIGFSMDDPPKYTIEECKAQDATYAAPIKVQVRLRNKETGEIKEQEIFMGDFPIMTDAGTFVINGAERVIVSQIVRSPGVYFARNADKADNITYASTVIPYRGAWLEYETDLSDVFYVRIDKNRKLPVTCLIRAVGPRTDAEILELFGEDPRILATLEKDACKTYEEAMLEIYRKLRPGEPPTVEASESLIKNLFFDPRRYDLSMVGRYKFNKKLSLWTRIHGQKLAYPVADPRTGEILFDAGHVMTSDEARELDAIGVNDVTLDLDGKTLRVHVPADYTNMPASVMEQIRLLDADVTVDLRWNGERLTITPATAQRKTALKAFWTFEQLCELYAQAQFESM